MRSAIQSAMLWTTTHSGRIASAAALSAAVIALAVGAWVGTWGSVDHFVRAVDQGRDLFSDFVLRFHPVAADFLELRKPYPGYYYSPTFAVILLPFGAMAPEPAVRAWGVFQVACSLLLLVVPMFWLARRSRFMPYAYALTFLTAMPVLHNFVWGQVSAPLVLCVFGALFLHRRGRTVPAAMLLALATAVKFYPGIYLVYFVLRRDVRFLVAFAVWLVVFGLAVPAAVLGPADTVGFYRQVVENLETDRGKMARGVNSQFVPHVVERWTIVSKGPPAPIRGRETPIRTTLRVACLAWFALHVVLLARNARRGAHPIHAFAVLSASIPLLVPSSWPHYFVFLPFFQAWAWLRTRRVPRGRALLRALILVSILASTLPAYRWIGDWRSYAYLGFPLLATLALLIVLYVPALVRRR